MAVDHSLELANGSHDEDDDVHRTGTLRSSVAHIIAAVIGSGVLSLAWSTAQLGWIAGPVCLVCFAIVTFVSSFLLADCYVDPIKGTRNRTYVDAVRVHLGKTHTIFCGILQVFYFCGNAVAYIITTSTSMRAIQKSNCYHRKGHNAECGSPVSFYMAVFGVIQLFMSQIPNFHDILWLSVVAALMSFCYAFTGFGLGVATVIKNGTIKGNLTGISTHTTAEKIWLLFQAVGDIAFAYPYALILLEIQDTIKSPPPPNKVMKKATMIGNFIITFFYLCCGCFGYAAFGDLTPGNLLTGFGFYEPFWLLDFANACVIVHLLGAYQIFSQPIFAYMERWASNKFPDSVFVNKFYRVKLPLIPVLHISPFRIVSRSIYVSLTTTVAMLFPYFNLVLGVLGALNFWPLAIYFPVEMYFVQHKVQKWTKKWVVLRTLSCFCLLVTVIGLMGSIQGIISAKMG